MGRYDEILARFMALAEREPREKAYTTQWVQNAFEN